jgi:hypothetical protein
VASQLHAEGAELQVTVEYLVRLLRAAPRGTGWGDLKRSTNHILRHLSLIATRRDTLAMASGSAHATSTSSLPNRLEYLNRSTIRDYQQHSIVPIII